MIHRKKLKMLVKYIIRLTLKNLVDFIYQFYVLNIWYISTLNFNFKFFKYFETLFNNNILLQDPK